MAQVRIVGAISGSVQDTTGAVVPGAKVVLKDEGTGITKETTTGAGGSFLFPDLSFGSYEVTVSLEGFQSAVYRNVVVEASRTTDLAVKLQVGAVAESIEVTGVAPTLETTTTVVSRTIAQDAIAQLPTGSRSILNFARLVPGMTATSEVRFNNMPGGSINVTIDGINNASNGWKSGGTSFYNTVPARQGAIEEITVETSGLGADSGGQSGTNIKFVTKRGGMDYHGSVFYQPQHEQLNANSWSRNAQGIGYRNKSRTHEFGGNLGGRLVPVGYLKDKLFFFVNFEDVWQPAVSTRSHNVLLPEAQQGIWTYKATNGAIRSVNVLEIARAAGFPYQIDPTIASIMAKQNSALKEGYLLPIANNYNQQSFRWNAQRNQNTYYPTTRLDYQITPSLSINFKWNLRHSWNPGFKEWPLPENDLQGQFLTAGYFIYSAAVNWAIGPRTFNEFNYGVQHSGDTTPNTGPGYYDINGRLMRLSMSYLDPMVAWKQPITGRHYIATMYDTATLIRDTHNITIGGTYRSTDWRDTEERMPVDQFSTGMPTGDPAANLFTTDNVPGIQNTELGNLRNFYAMLTGRVSSITRAHTVDAKTRAYGPFVDSTWTRSYMGGFYFQDSWRVKPNLTLNYGLRWEMQGDQYNVDAIVAFPDMENFWGPSKGLFQPGVLSGVTDPVMKRGQHAYKADMANPAPNFGFAWNPNFEEGLLGRLFGGSKTVLRGSMGITYYDEGTNMFAWSAGGNPGKRQTLNITPGQYGVPYGFTLQDLPLPEFQAFPTAYADTFRISDFFGNNGATIGAMNPNLKAPYIVNWSFGIQRELAKDTVLEVRYVGNSSKRGWRTFNLNEVNIFENGFLEEFKNAQKNLELNKAVGVNSFANRGLAGQVALPILEAAFGPNGSMPALSSSQGFGSSTFRTHLENGTAGAMANTLTQAIYSCRMFGSSFGPCAEKGYDGPGAYPINFWRANPYLTGMNYVDDVGASNYNGLQVQLRRRYSNGVQFTANYTFSHAMTNSAVSNANMAGNWRTLRDRSLNRQPSQFDLRHVLQVFGTYDLPIGRGRAVPIENRVLNAVAGGWTVGSIMTVQSGSLVSFSSGRGTVNNEDAGIILNGVTPQELQDLFEFRPGPVNNRYFLPEKFIGPDGRANPEYFITPTTPGVWGNPIFLYGKNNFSLDASMNKRFSVTERLKLDLWGSASNILNHPTWGIGTLNIQSTSFGQVGPPGGGRSITVRGVLSF